MSGFLDRLWSRSPAAPATQAAQRGEPGTVLWFADEVLTPGLLWMAQFVPPGGPQDTPAVRRWLLAVAMQESALRHRTQLGGGPARGWWQFEQGGGVVGVLRHQASAKIAAAACAAAMVPTDAASVWRAIEGHDRLAVTFARLLLWTDPYPVPTDEVSAWACYMRLWRPGKPNPAKWPENWRRAAQVAE